MDDEQSPLLGGGPKKKEFSNLIVCFGHAGGGDWWTGGRAGFGQKVYELCVTYPHVYCELSIFDGILNDSHRLELQKRLSELFKTKDKDYEFSKKVMYGTDWHMLSATKNYPEFLEAATLLFRHDDLSKYTEQFFSANALAFLGVDKNDGYGWPRLSGDAKTRVTNIRSKLRANK